MIPNEIIAENKKRNALLDSYYNPITGEGSLLERFKLTVEPKVNYYLPVQMENLDYVKDIQRAGSVRKFVLAQIPMHIDVSQEMIDSALNVLNKMRYKYDFEYWAYANITIKDKESGELIKFKLNSPQRKYIARLEKMRFAKVPIRIVLLKARQWGGSTLTQIYAFYLQVEHRINWNSCIIGDIESQSANVRGMFTTAAKYYPASSGTITLKPFEKQVKNIQVQETGAIISIGSAQKPDALRSTDLKLAHYTECASWKETLGKKPKDLIQTISGTIPNIADTMIVVESTAKGVGNYFHDTWKRAETGLSGYDPVFVSWLEIEMYRAKFVSREQMNRFWDGMDDYEKYLWKMGATLEGIKWYRNKLHSDFGGDRWVMASEFPSTCIAKDMRVGTDLGLLPISEIKNAQLTEYGSVSNFMANGKRQVFKLVTKMGYSLRCTDDHRIMTDSGEWVELKNLKVNDRITLSKPLLAKEEHSLKYKDNTFVDVSISITPEFARFLGIFMGDGSYHAQTISIACDARDMDFVKLSKDLVKKLFNLSMSERLIGKNKGCLELRGSNMELSKYFLKLGIVDQGRSRESNRGSFKRIICVPDIIFRSPKNVVKEFLAGIFETDGFCGYGVPKIGLFSKHTQFLKDIQLLLLSFGVTSILRTSWQKNGGGFIYLANTLILQGEQADKYRDEIGFLSNRKKDAFKSWGVRSVTKRTKNVLSDIIVSIEDDGIEDVYDITVDETHKFSVNGIVVHNCLEAFQSTGHRVFPPAYVQNIRATCIDPLHKGYLTANAIKGAEALNMLAFVDNPNGDLYLWAKPDTSIVVKNRYLVSVDIGGKTSKADYSVIRVIDRYWLLDGGSPEMVATWKAHVDQDLLAWVAVQIAKWYNNALLAFESNSLRRYENTEGDGFLTVLNEIAEYYPNLYAKTDLSRINEGLPVIYGYHINMVTKSLVINTYKAAMRDGEYIERDIRAADEADTYEYKNDGSMGAVTGSHDDITMSTAINLQIALKEMEPPRLIEVDKDDKKKRKLKSKIKSEATF